MFDTERERAAVVSVADVWQPASVFGATAGFDAFDLGTAGWSFLPGTAAAGGVSSSMFRHRHAPGLMAGRFPAVDAAQAGGVRR